jgi:hypothetical protein
VEHSFGCKMADRAEEAKRGCEYYMVSLAVFLAYSENMNFDPEFTRIKSLTPKTWKLEGRQ